jgi:hypothetical protein
MPQRRRIARRGPLPLAAAVAALALLSPFALPAAIAAEPTPQPDAAREARAAWGGLPSSSQEAAAGAGDDSITIARLWRERRQLSGRTVRVTGTVVKYTANLLGTNWVHLSDGSGSRASRDDDLSVTTGGTAAVGDVVTVAGKVSVERDFGAGYAYPVMLEDARLIPAGSPAPPSPPPEVDETAAKQAAARRAGVPEEAVVAEGLGVRITAADFAARMAEQSPFIRSRYGTLERKLEFLDTLIRFELLAAEARRRGLERGPPPAPSESELRELYERLRAEAGIRIDERALDRIVVK